jgi:hypothetical protein
MPIDVAALNIYQNNSVITRIRTAMFITMKLNVVVEWLILLLCMAWRPVILTEVFLGFPQSCMPR